MRTDIEFKTEDGVVLRGWHYRPTNSGGPWPTIVMAHGYSVRHAEGAGVLRACRGQAEFSASLNVLVIRRIGGQRR
jgi:dipeptidyl aminopeptidase/acylaminoacyl peptidase